MTPEQRAQTLVDDGNACEDAGRLQDALRCYDTAIGLMPGMARAHLNRGNALLALGDPEGAVTAYTTALASQPDYAAAHYNLGNAHLRSGRRDAAQAAYRRALAIKPDFADAEVALGVIHEDLGELDAAAACYRRALQINPDYAPVYRSLGNLLQRTGQFEEAITSFRRALDLDSTTGIVHFNLGVALQSLGRHDEAVGAFGDALQLMPNLAEAHGSLGNALHALGRLQEAAASHRRALAISPNYAEVFCNLGNVLKEIGQLPEAVRCLLRAVEIRPDVAIFHFNLGNAQQATGALSAAIQSYRKASQLDPNHVETHVNLGGALHALGQYDAALASFRKAIDLKPDDALAHNNLGQTLKEQGHLDEAIVECRRALELDPECDFAQSNLLFIHNYLADQPAAALLAEARHFGELAARRAHPFIAWDNTIEKERLLRVGFVSGDLRYHAVGFFAEGALAALAAFGGVELFGYSTHGAGDEVTARIRKCCRGWVPAENLSDEALARRIRSDGVDILIDLSGHTAYNRLSMFAWKPAPVQASWLGYFATTGVSAIDYFIADPWTMTDDEEAHFTETTWRLPETRLCFTPPDENVPVSPLPALANGYVMFGCFNHLAKMNDAVVALWSRVLAAVPESRLFLKTKQLSEASVRGRVAERFAEHGVDPGRLLLEGPTSRAAYLAAYHRVDIALDPFPFPGGTTTVEALWMGVPVLTLAGQSFLSRQGVGLMTNAGLPDWVAVDADDYVARAASRAGDLNRLAALRSRLRDQVQASPLFDAPRFARHFEAALRGMWRIWCDQQSRSA